MIDLELIDGLAAEVRELLAEERSAFGVTIAEMRGEITALRSSIAAIPAGAKGDPGANGIDGKDGADGRSGEPGRDGKDGGNGIDGKDGANGKDGADGKPGEAGRDGKDGKDGTNGIDGKDGAPGIPGERGERGEKGERAIDGRDGRDGTNGKDGKDGRDGIATQDELEKRIEAATESLVRAITEKRIAEVIAALPIPLFKGVYRSGESYQPGHMVQFGGDIWHANAATSERPGPGETWTLALRKGRDGREPARAERFGGGKT